MYGIRVSDCNLGIHHDSRPAFIAIRRATNYNRALICALIVRKRGMTDKLVSVGVAGTSWWADAMHLPALDSHPRARTVAICGRNRANAQKMADSWGIPQVYTDYAEMIERADLDAIVISTPNSTHYPITMKAFERGLHVLCEKPIAMTYGQAREMAQTAAAKQLKTMAPFTYRYMPTARYLKALIDGGYLGRPYHLNMRYYTGYAREGDYRWRFDRKIAGAGVVGDLGPHFLYLADWLYGDITAISCRLSYSVPRPPLDPQGKSYEVLDDACMLTAEFANGAFGMIHCSALCYEDTPFGQTHHMEFHGSDGTLYSFTDWDKSPAGQRRACGGGHGARAAHTRSYLGQGPLRYRAQYLPRHVPPRRLHDPRLHQRHHQRQPALAGFP